MLMGVSFAVGLSYGVVGDFKIQTWKKDMLCVLQH